MAAPLDIDTALEWRGRTVVDRDGEKVGKLEELYLDDSDRPAWGAVSTGLFGRRQSFVPLGDLRPAGDDLQVPYEKERVKDAPNVDPDEQLSGEDEDALHRHYGIADDTPEVPAPEGEADGGTERVGDGDGDGDASGDGGDGAEMIRSEEEVDVSTRRRVSGRARLRKYVVTEHVQKVVPVQREEVRVEFEPAGEEDAEEASAREGGAGDETVREETVRDDVARDDAAGERARRD